MFRANKYNHSRFRSPNACPICGNEVPVNDLFCGECGMRMHNHKPEPSYNRFGRENPQPGNMSHPSSYGASSPHVRRPSGPIGVGAAYDPKRDWAYSGSFDSKYDDMDALLEQMQADVENRIMADFTEGKIFENLGRRFLEQRDFGLDKCTEAAKEVFNLGVFMSWGRISPQQKMKLAADYARKVAEAFELVRFKGVKFEDMEPGVYGSNCGDGIIHVSTVFAFNGYLSPFMIIDTVTHESRHQYQAEAVAGYHNVPDEVVKEWKISDQIYNGSQSCCFDPWGYRYNPSEIDARYAAETVVRNISRDWFNAKGIKGKKAIDRISLRQRLSREGYPEQMLDSTVHNLLQLEGKAAHMLEAWLHKGIKPEFGDIEGVNSDILRNRLKMKEPAIILSYGMLVNNPSGNSGYFKNLLSD